MEHADWRLKDTAGRVVIIHLTSVAAEGLHVHFLFQINVSSIFYFAHLSIRYLETKIEPLTRLDVCREGVNDMRIRVRIGYGILLATYLAVELSVILGCPSFHKNWQIFPDPGSK